VRTFRIIDKFCSTYHAWKLLSTYNKYFGRTKLWLGKPRLGNCMGKESFLQTPSWGKSPLPINRRELIGSKHSLESTIIYHIPLLKTMSSAFGAFHISWATPVLKRNYYWSSLFLKKKTETSEYGCKKIHQFVQSVSSDLFFFTGLRFYRIGYGCNFN
jgi:hypothetical protein